jgi:hypothetical protein
MVATAALCAILAVSSSAFASVLHDGAFNTPDNGGVGQMSGYGCAPSGASYWLLCNDDQAATTSSDLEPSTRVPGGTMMHVITNSPSGSSGLDQTFAAVTSPQYLCVWVYVISGKVGVGAGDGSSTVSDVIELNQGTWEVLNAGSNPGAPAVSEVVLFSYNGPAEFDIESARLGSSQSQCHAQ